MYTDRYCMQRKVHPQPLKNHKNLFLNGPKSSREQWKESHQILWFFEAIEQFHSSHVIFWKNTYFKYLWQLGTLNTISAPQKYWKTFVLHLLKYRYLRIYHKYLQIPTVSLSYLCEFHTKQCSMENVKFAVQKGVLKNGGASV